MDYADDADYVSHRLEHAPGSEFWDHFSPDFYDRVHEEQVSLDDPEPEVITSTNDALPRKPSAMSTHLTRMAMGLRMEETVVMMITREPGTALALPPPTPTNLAVVRNWSLGASSARSERRAAWKGSRWTSRTVLPAANCSPRRHSAG